MNRLDTLEPAFKTKVLALLAATEAATGRKWKVSDGRRTLTRQEALYAQGRTAPGKIVTMAKPGSSAHNFGLAADLWPLTPSGDFDWGAGPEIFRPMADAAKELGLVPGFYFKSIFDAPHVEDPEWKLARAKWQAGELKVA